MNSRNFPCVKKGRTLDIEVNIDSYSKEQKQILWKTHPISLIFYPFFNIIKTNLGGGASPTQLLSLTKRRKKKQQNGGELEKEERNKEGSNHMLDSFYELELLLGFYKNFLK